jgi:penicillin-binding protein 1C
MGSRWVALLAAGLCAAVVFARTGRPPLREGLSFSQAVYDRDGRLLRLTLAADQRYRLWTPLSRISPLLADATMLQEDRHFRRHWGADIPALARAAWSTYGTRGRRMGGSTITMQLARLRYGIRSRTPLGKARQLAKAFQLELFYSKDEILEAYLNLAPYGGSVEGAGAASLVYFGKEASQLTLTEALTLAVIPQNPGRRSLADESAARQAARKALFARWAKTHPADVASAGLLDSPWRTGTTAELPFEAPHFVNGLLAAHRETRLATTLDLRLQRLLERLVRDYAARRASSGIRNAAAILVDARSMEVLASVGSARFEDDAIQGQVNGLRAPRSPGSTLKPFIYALAMDQGLLHGQTMLKDAPTSFGGFNPENFDNEFSGPVKVWEALIRSRNVPAVTVSSQLKSPTLYEFLKSAGLPLPHDPDYYGLGLALGGAELTAEDLARLYAMLANAGELRPLRKLRGEPQAEPRRLLSREASFMVMDILKDNPRPHQAFKQDWTRAPLPVYWKTGTSFAFRDAWTAGVFGPYVAVVWIGNFNGEGNPSFVGIDAAAPLFFEVVDAIRAQQPRLRDLASSRLDRLNLASVRVCSVTGKAPGPHCPHTVAAVFIPGVSPIAPCDVHQEILVNARGLRACRAGPGTRARTYEFWPSDLLRIFRQAGVPRRLPPEYDPSCGIASQGRGRPPQITSPLPGVTYTIRSGSTDEQIALAAVTDADTRRLFWFVDGRLLGRTPDGRPLFWSPQPGRYTVRVVDDQGRADAREVTVALAD